MDNKGSFTGWKRERKTTLSVRLADTISKRLITVVGIGTIIAVSTVCVFLFYVAFPLFESPDVSSVEEVRLAADNAAAIEMRSDEYNVTGFRFAQDGTLVHFRMDTGETVQTFGLAGDKQLTASKFEVGGRSGIQCVLGYADGSVRMGTVTFNVGLVDATLLNPVISMLEEGGLATVDGAVVSSSRTGFRKFQLSADFGDPVMLCEGTPIEIIDSAETASGQILAALSKDGQIYLRRVTVQENLLTGEETIRLSGGELPLDAPPEWGQPKFIQITSSGNMVSVAWSSGMLMRFDTRNLDNPQFAEQVDLLSGEEEAAELTAFDAIIGNKTLVAGDSNGNVAAWFTVRRDPAADTVDGWTLVKAHELPGEGSAVTAIESSTRTRSVVIGYANGHLRLFHLTTNQLLKDVDTGAQGGINAVALAPKEDAVLAMTGDTLRRWDIDVKHPEATFASMFLPVWYDSASAPVHAWQSSGIDDSFEPKFGMMPLVFGTLKATLYSLLFGVPLALLAAIYTSEFLHPKIRTSVKPGIEMMASLPSVVLGFLAALVIAPFVQDVVPSVLSAMVLMPFCLLLSAQLWQLLPRTTTLNLLRYRLFFILGALLVGLFAAVAIAPAVERFFFAPDIMTWLRKPSPDEIPTSPTGGWFVLFLPLSLIGIWASSSTWVSPWLRGLMADKSRTQVAVVDLLRFCATSVLTLLIAFVISYALGRLGLDARGGSSFLGKYDQRNALVVGFIMGFAIIPIIYTIAEDALSTVPDHLRAASLGAGATPWQTCTRIVIPAAMSGLFSAIMIGLGRAVGETMIVLMAAGNTPVMEWNMFNGLRTLSANIAVELPEAPQGSTHYRTLFMAALVLFVMTFLINTVAEGVRLRFRKKASSL